MVMKLTRAERAALEHCAGYFKESDRVCWSPWPNQIKMAMRLEDLGFLRPARTVNGGPGWKITEAGIKVVGR